MSVRNAAFCLAAALLSGCASTDIGPGYYWQSVTGHLKLMHAARPVQGWLDDPATPPALQQKLLLTQRIRRFAVDELGLPDNASYQRYADLQRKAAVYNVVAATRALAAPAPVVFSRRRVRRLPRLLRRKRSQGLCPGSGQRSGCGRLPSARLLHAGLDELGRRAIRCSTPSSATPKASWPE